MEAMTLGLLTIKFSSILRLNRRRRGNIAGHSKIIYRDRPIGAVYSVPNPAARPINCDIRLPSPSQSVHRLILFNAKLESIKFMSLFVSIYQIPVEGR